MPSLREELAMRPRCEVLIGSRQHSMLCGQDRQPAPRHDKWLSISIWEKICMTYFLVDLSMCPRMSAEDQLAAAFKLGLTALDSHHQA